jgi:hypothetical protein
MLLSAEDRLVDHSWFAADSPLEETGFEPLVPPWAADPLVWRNGRVDAKLFDRCAVIGLWLCGARRFGKHAASAMERHQGHHGDGRMPRAQRR